VSRITTLQDLIDQALNRATDEVKRATLQEAYEQCDELKAELKEGVVDNVSHQATELVMLAQQVKELLE